MLREKEYIFLSLMIPQEIADEVKQYSSNNMADAANALEHNLMEGFAANLPTPPKVINVLPIGSYPQYYRKAIVKKSTFQLCGRSDHENLGFCNIKFIRNFFIERAVYKSLKTYCKAKAGEVVLCIYSASAEFLAAAEKLKKKYPNVIVCDIIADLPGMTNLSSKKSALLQWFIDYKARKSLNHLECADCFVLLTKQMADHEGTRLCLELLQQIHDFSQCDLVGHGDTAVTTVCIQNRFHAIEFAVLLLAFQQVEHSFYKIVDVQQLQLGATVVDSKGLVIGDCPAEGANGAIVLGAAVSHQVDKTVDGNLCAGFLSILEEQLLARLFAPTILAVAETTSQGGLNGGGQHDGCLVVVLFQAVQQIRCKAEVSLHEVFRVLRAIHACQIEHEVRLTAVLVQLRRGGIQIVLVDFFNVQCRAGFVLAVPNVFQVITQGGSHHSLSTCD